MKLKVRERLENIDLSSLNRELLLPRHLMQLDLCTWKVTERDFLSSQGDFCN